MKLIDKLMLKIFFFLCRVLLPRRYNNRFFIMDFIGCRYLKRLSSKKIIWCFLKGFLPIDYFAFNLDENDYRKYMPSLTIYRKATINGIFNKVLNNKLFFEKYLKTIINGVASLNVIESIAFIDRGYMYSFHPEVISGDFFSLSVLLEKNDLILKPVGGRKGQGVLFLRKSDNFFLLDGEKIEWEDLNKYLSTLNNYIIQEKFVQRGLSHDIHPDTLNSIRITTMIDPETQLPFIAYACHKFGSEVSGNVDNVSQGGVSAMIDVDSGKLGICRYVTPEGKVEIFDHHPSTGNPILNEQIENWKILIESLLEMAAKMPYYKYIGWDVVFSDNELYILEGNNCPGETISQMHMPLSEIPKVWKFFRYHNYFD